MILLTINIIFYIKFLLTGLSSINISIIHNIIVGLIYIWKRNVYSMELSNIYLKISFINDNSNIKYINYKKKCKMITFSVKM